jgi:hypothetical protein
MKDRIIELIVAAVSEALFFLTISLFLPDKTLQYLFAAIFGLTIIVILIVPRDGTGIKDILRTLQVRGSKQGAGDIEESNFYDRSFAFHQMIHRARNLSVSLMPIVPPYAVNAREPSAPDLILETHRVVIKEMLERLAEVFSEVAPPGVKIWTSLRDRRGDHCYHTFERAGQFRASRAETSQPMHKDKSHTVTWLKNSYHEGSCVFISGSTQGPQRWQSQENDKYGEDKSILMGAVMTKSPSVRGQDSTWKNPKLTWILFVNADKEGIFAPRHIPLMRCCVVTFSWLANSMIRSPVFDRLPEDSVNG